MDFEKADAKNEVKTEFDTDLSIPVPPKGKRGYTENELKIFERQLEEVKIKVAAAKRDVAERKRKEATRLKIRLGGMIMKYIGPDLPFEQYEAIIKSAFSRSQEPEYNILQEAIDSTHDF